MLRWGVLPPPEAAVEEKRMLNVPAETFMLHLIKVVPEAAKELPKLNSAYGRSY